MQNIEYLKEKVRNLPYSPGVYLMKDENGTVIYVGKSKALRNRVGQYFLSSSGHSPKTAKMVSNVCDFEIIITKTEFEALVLECSLIKKYRPKYNILLKDDKGYSYIKFTLGASYPELSVVTSVKDDGARYFGPYMGKGAAAGAVAALREALKLPTCSRKFPRDIGKERPCLNYHLGKCCAPCNGEISEKQFRGLCEQAAQLLEGKHIGLIGSLEHEMTEAAENLRFEKAAILRDRVAAVKKITEKQNIISGAFADTDVISVSTASVKGCIVVLHYISGTLLGKETQLLGEISAEYCPEILGQFIVHYYSSRRQIPAEILISHEIDGIDAISAWLKSLCGHKVTVAKPQKGIKRSLIELASKNALDEALRSETAEQRDSKILSMLSELLGLPDIPNRIESFDISHTAGENIVAGMVVFENAKPKRSEYRKFNIKYVDGQNDTACMAEVVRRRFIDMLEHKHGFENSPDLLLLDGGIGQVNAINEQLAELNISVPVFGMVKNNKHRTEAIVTSDGKKIGITATPALFGFIGKIQEEVHRYSITFHREKRSKAAYKSALDKISGIGSKRKATLLKHFKTISAIKSADINILTKFVPYSIALELKEKL